MLSQTIPPAWVPVRHGKVEVQLLLLLLKSLEFLGNTGSQGNQALASMPETGTVNGRGYSLMFLSLQGHSSY